MGKAVFANDESRWREWRRTGIGGSDAPIVMGVSPWMTPLDLWRIKLGMAPESGINDAMRRGIAMEQLAREKYEAHTGLVVQPACIVHPEHEWMRGSLDGLSFDRDLVTEIKCPGRVVHEEAKAGRIPERYWPQLQHYLMISGASVLHYWSFDGVEGVLIPVEPDQSYQELLFEKEQAFWRSVLERKAPEAPVYAGRIEYQDAATLALARHYARLAEESQQVQRELDKIKAKLTTICGGAVNRMGPLTIVRCRGKATLDQHALARDGIDLDHYRKRGGDFWKVEVQETDRDPSPEPLGA
jgi:putative phage-type endonuclease